jgi:hypothetical protein
VDHAAFALVAVQDGDARAQAEIRDAAMNGHGAGDGVEFRKADPLPLAALQLGEDEVAL